jgi:hypothetical protein
MANFTGSPVPSSSPISAAYDLPVGSLIYYGAPVQFAQRVWSTGSVPPVWCYYIGPINASPAATDTTPNWVGSAIRHEVLGPV